MKKYWCCLIVIVCGILQFGEGAGQLPDYLREYSCRKSDPEYEKCTRDAFEKTRPFFVKGIPELGVPPLDPFELPLMTVNRTLNDVVSVAAICRNIKVVGGANAIIEALRADPVKGQGEISITVPWMYMEMEYDVNGHLLVIPLQSKGFFRGNFTNIQIHTKGSVEKYLRDNEEYFKVKKIDSKISVGDGYIKLTAKNPDLQIGADIITTFFNQNARRVMDAVNPIFVETANELYRVVADQILATIPAKEWLPAK